VPLDATVAGATADSYLSVADATALATNDYGPERDWWLGAGGEDRELALKRATAEIDDYLRSGWTRYDRSQALLFPREIDYDSAGSPFVPVRVGRATYYQAAFLLKNVKVIAAAGIRKMRGQSNASEANMSYTQAQESEVAVLSPRAMQALDSYARSGGKRSVRSVHMAAGYGR
jgi:hypothetical protein